MISVQIRWLVGVVLVLGAISLALLKGQSSSTSPNAPAFLLPELGANAHRVSDIVIENGNNDTLTIQRRKDNWIVSIGETAHPFPANPEVLKALLSSLSAAQIREAKTGKPQYHALLGVESRNFEDSYSTQITIFADSHNWSLLVGKVATSGAGTYVRFPDDNQAWLIDQTVELPLSRVGWLDKSVVSLKDITKITRTDDQHRWWIEKSDSGETTLFPNKNELTYRYPTILDNYITSWSELTFSDLIWMDETIAQALPEPISKFYIENKKEQVASIGLYRYRDRVWLNCEGCYQTLDTSHWLVELSPFSLAQIDKASADFFQNSGSLTD